MASKNLMTRAFSPAEIAEYSTLTVQIEGAQKQADGLARVIAGALARVKARKLYEYEGYKNIYEYGEQRHGIARGTVSDAINVYERFQNPDNKGSLLPEYEPFAWRALIMMKAIPNNDDIARLGIRYDMKSAEIKQRIKDYKEVSNIADLPDNWDYDYIKEVINDSKAITMTEEPEETVDQSETGTPQTKPDTPVSAEGKSSSQEDIVTRAQNMMTEEEWEEFRETESDDLVQACSDYVETFTSFPKKVINIADMSDKDALAEIKKLIAGARNGEYDIIITA